MCFFDFSACQCLGTVWNWNPSIQSSLCWFSYELEDRFRPEFRISADNYFEALSAEAILTYDIVNKSDFEFYAGLGYRGYDFRGLTVPIGINVYPFEVKKFGFHIELTPILGEESLLRGSWGIRYRFKSQN